MKGVFIRFLFNVLHDHYIREYVIDRIRNAKLTMNASDVWITPDLPLPSRAEKRFLLGLKRQMVQWQWQPFEINVDLEARTLSIDDFAIVTVCAHHQVFDINFAPGWADKLKSDELTALIQYARKQMAEYKKGKGKGGGKDQGVEHERHSTPGAGGQVRRRGKKDKKYTQKQTPGIHGGPRSEIGQEYYQCRKIVREGK